MFITSNYFNGHEVSEEGKKRRRVDYATLAKCFNAVLNNDIMQELEKAGFYFESENLEEYTDNDGNTYDCSAAQDKIEELKNELEELENTRDELEENEEENAAALEEINNKISDIEENIKSLEEPNYKDIYQYYIVDDNGADILRKAGEILFYNSDLDLYIWGVDHWGTSWSYVMTSIEIRKSEN